MASLRRRPSGQRLHANASVLEYARFHSICRDHTLENPLDPHYVPQAPVFLSQDLADPTSCLQVPLTEEPDTSEKLEIDTSSLAALKSALTPAPLPPDSEQHSHPRLFRDFKVELPVLNNDHELDAQRFRHRHSHDSLHLRDLTLPLELTNEEQDEGLTWPPWYEEISLKCHNELASGKLEIPKEAMLYLHSVFTQPQRPDTPDPELPKRRSVHPVTPPLLPIDPALTHTPGPSSSSPTGQVQLLSEATNSTAIEAEALETEIFKQDRIGTPDAPALTYYTEDPMLFDETESYSDVGELALPLKTRRQAAELKIETPLTPPATLALRSSTKETKSVSFPDDEMLFEYFPELPSKYENGNSVLDSEDDFDQFFQEEVAPIAEKVDRRLENEKLQEFDTTKRVEVPDMDFDVLVAPWDLYSMNRTSKRDGIHTELEAQKKLLSRCATEELGLVPKWNESKRRELDMVWNPFPHNLPKSALSENIQHDADLDRIIGGSAMKDVDIVESGSLAWKLDGLRILDEHDEDDEEISTLSFEPGNDIDSLVRKRRLEIADVDNMTTTQPGDSTEEAMSQLPQKKRKVKQQASQQRPAYDSSFMSTGIFSTSTSLARFMQLQTGIPITNETSEPTYPNMSAAQPEITPNKENAVSEAENSMGLLAGEGPTPIPLPRPPLQSQLAPKPFIISTSLSIHRRDLVKSIQTLYPAAQLIERDLSQTAAPPNPSAGPDLILSPSTGLVLTTLQRLKQRSLPGQPHAATGAQALQTQLSQLAPSFPHLLVLVASASPHHPDPSDCAALASLHASAASLLPRTRVSVALVPGDDRALAAWIAAAMAGAADGFAVVDDETLWERWLRRAGLNAFAAQAVLARVKDVGPGGPAAFVAMRAEERERVLAEVLGGGGVLERVGRRVDGMWPRVKG
ncbi:hypothetical protein SLS56_009883 [Neofusicoccum ribis]|uniref:Uncharacterized protein n=1 Tax=Neofusicoccum ribis TaxID=45134 RepID=A0ABR3SG24_9PEZI